jgi:hypothetical protein
VPARDARSRSAHEVTPGKRRRTATPAANARRRGPARPAPTAPALDRLVVGTVPTVARVAGVLLVLAGLTAAAAAFPTYLVVGGTRLSIAPGLVSAVIALLLPVAHIAVGVLLVRGAVPKFGLAYAGVAAALAVGQLFIELYLGSSSTDRPGVEVIAGERVVTSTVEVGGGWVLSVVGLGLTVLAGIVAGVAWPRTVMEDDGSLDPARPGLAGAAVVLAVGTVLCLALPAADVPDRVVTDPATGMETVVTQEGPLALLERPGLALLGGLLLAGAVVLSSVVATSLRPRLAVVGGLLAIAVAVLSAALTGLRDAVSSADLEWTLPGAGLLLCAVGLSGLTVLAWRLRRAPA